MRSAWAAHTFFHVESIISDQFFGSAINEGPVYFSERGQCLYASVYLLLCIIPNDDPPLIAARKCDATVIYFESADSRGERERA